MVTLVARDREGRVCTSKEVVMKGRRCGRYKGAVINVGRIKSLRNQAQVTLLDISCSYLQHLTFSGCLSLGGARSRMSRMASRGRLLK